MAAVALLEEAEQLAAEHAAEHPHREEESSSPGWDPARVIERQAACRNETVQMRRMLQVLTPSMKNSEHADAGTKVARIGGDLQQGLRSRTKQHGIEESLVAQSQRWIRPHAKMITLLTFE